MTKSGQKGADVLKWDLLINILGWKLCIISKQLHNEEQQIITSYLVCWILKLRQETFIKCKSFLVIQIKVLVYYTMTVVKNKCFSFTCIYSNILCNICKSQYKMSITDLLWTLLNILMSLACKCFKNWKAVDLLIKISLGINEAALGSLTMCYSIEDVDKTVTTHWLLLQSLVLYSTALI